MGYARATHPLPYIYAHSRTFLVIFSWKLQRAFLSLYRELIVWSGLTG